MCHQGARVNLINTLIEWAVMSNMQSVLTDCPHRDRLGWLEENHLMLHPIMFGFDIPMLLERIGCDIREAQLDNGLVPDIAPEYVVFGGGVRESPQWGSASVIMPWYAYNWFGDRRILEDNYDAMQRYARYLESTATDQIAKPGLGDWYDYVPGQNPGGSKLTPTRLTATAIYYYDVTILEKVARRLGRASDADGYARQAEGGRSDVICAMTNRTDLPGYGAILEAGATSLTEAWDALPTSSLNHFVLGHIQEWFQQDLAGIQPDPAAPAFKAFIIRPQVVGGLSSVAGHYDSVDGRIESAWRVEDGKLTLRVGVPVNTTATVLLPTASAEDVTESNVPTADAEGVTFLKYEDGAPVYGVGSGAYAFRAPAAR